MRVYIHFVSSFVKASTPHPFLLLVVIRPLTLPPSARSAAQQTMQKKSDMDMDFCQSEDNSEQIATTIARETIKQTEDITKKRGSSPRFFSLSVFLFAPSKHEGNQTKPRPTYQTDRDAHLVVWTTPTLLKITT